MINKASESSEIRIAVELPIVSGYVRPLPVEVIFLLFEKLGKTRPGPFRATHENVGNGSAANWPIPGESETRRLRDKIVGTSGVRTIVAFVYSHINSCPLRYLLFLKYFISLAINLSLTCIHF